MDDPVGLVADQVMWMLQCGGDITGYVKKYGSAADPNHYGNGGEAIFDADLRELGKRVEKYLARHG